MSRTGTPGDRIIELRKALGLTQIEFAKRVGVGQPQVSAWEVGSDSPSPGAYLRLGNLASYPDNIWFWEQAGMDVQAMLSAAEKLLEERGAPPLSGEIVRIPCFRKTAHGEQDTDRLVIFRGEEVPNPLSTVCWVVDDSAESPWVPSGSLIVFDTSKKNAKDLWGQSVVLENDPGPVIPPETSIRWSKGLLAGKLQYQAVGHPIQTGGYSVWEVTVGPFGDLKTEPVRVGLLSVAPAGRAVRAAVSTFQPHRSGEAHAAHHDEVSKRVPSEIGLYTGCRILGRMIDFRPPPATKLKE
jgi:transcriptional regulator with XRE-family HTH domain